MNRQTLKNKKGEIKFKKDLFSHQIENKKVFEDEFNSEGIERILLERMQKTKGKMEELAKKIILSPYVEVGAERGQRSLVMENDINSRGAAADLSLDMLLTAEYYAKKFNKEKLPLRACCDAYNLPFLSNSLPFVFCYETLHHFPDPEPIINEICRVLAPGGYFFFDEEPCRGLLQIKLFQAKDKIYSKEANERSFFRQVFEYFFYQKSCNELDYGILENDNIPLYKWEKMFSCFEKKQLSLLGSRSLFKSEVFGRKNILKYALAHMLGGALTGLFKKPGELRKNFEKIENLLRCPECAESGKENRLDKKNDFYECPACREKYLFKSNVLVVFEKKELQELYF